MNDDVQSSSDFLRRALRALAILSLAYSIISVTGYAVSIATQGFPGYGSPYRSRGLIGLMTSATIGGMVAIVIVLIGSWGLLRWKRWSRLLLLLGAIGMICFSVISNASWLIYYINELSYRRAATSQPAAINPPVWGMIWSMLSQCAHWAAFPLVIIWAMMQDDVRRLWASDAAGGFEVVPMAKTLAQGNGP